MFHMRKRNTRKQASIVEGGCPTGGCENRKQQCCVPHPWHFGTDPDPCIRTLDNGSGSCFFVCDFQEKVQKWHWPDEADRLDAGTPVGGEWVLVEQRAPPAEQQEARISWQAVQHRHQPLLSQQQQAQRVHRPRDTAELFLGSATIGLICRVRYPKFIWAPVYSCLIAWDTATPPHPPHFWLTYEGAIGQPR